MTPAKVALLRRAINLATDVGAEISGVRRGQALRAQSIVAPGTWGYDAAYSSENSVFDLGRAKALLDVYGYVDRDGDGWREQPDGKPLVIDYATQPDSLSRQFDELWKKKMDALGVKLRIKPAQWPEQLKSARAGQLMVWQLGYTASNPDVQDGLQLLYGPAAGGSNLGRFKDARFDRLYDQMQSLPDGPKRLADLREALAIITAYAPMKFNVHTIANVLTQARGCSVIGGRSSAACSGSSSRSTTPSAPAPQREPRRCRAHRAAHPPLHALAARGPWPGVRSDHCRRLRPSLALVVRPTSRCSGRRSGTTSS